MANDCDLWKAPEETLGIVGSVEPGATECERGCLADWGRCSLASENCSMPAKEEEERDVEEGVGEGEFSFRVLS